MNFDALTQYLDRLPGRGIPGCEARVWVEHECVYSHASGMNGEKPVSGKDLYWLYSASKVICMTAAMQLIERGVIGLDDPVSKYIPAYANLLVEERGAVRPARTVMTLRHLMTMCCGLDYDREHEGIRECLRRYGAEASNVQLAEAFAAKPLRFDPGTRYLYSLGHDVMAAVIEVAAGMTYGEYVRRNIVDPLEIPDLTFHPSEAQLAQVAAAWTWDDDGALEPVDRFAQPYRLSERHESGGAGLLGSADSYMQVADALANGGVGKNGARILRPESINLMRSNQLSGSVYQSFVQKMTAGRMGYSYGLGVRTLIDNRRAEAPAGEFGWDGAAGAYVMMDVERRLAVFYVQHVLNCNLAFHEIHPSVRDLVYAGLRDD